MNDLPGGLEVIANRVDELEKRIYALEHPAETIAPVIQTALQNAIVPEDGGSAMEQVGGWLPVAGRAMFGIAGAYVLRAMAESSVFPRQSIAAIAVVYAMGWLVWAALSSKVSSMARAVYASTSALILAPMLWELTLHFKVFSPALTAVLLAAYATTAAVLGLRRDIAPVMWVAQGAGSLTAFVLSIATHDLIPFIATLILMVALCEYARLRHRRPAATPLVAIVTDVAIGALIFIYSGPPIARGDYLDLSALALLAPACLLFIVNGTSVAIETVARKRRILIFEVLQLMVASALTASSLLIFVPGSGIAFLGGICIVLSVAGYVAHFWGVRNGADRRNLNFFSAWSAGLMLAGAFLTSPLTVAAVCLGIAAPAMLIVGVLTKCRMLEFHGLLFLAAATVASQMPEYVFRMLGGQLPGAASLGIFASTVSAVLCYAALRGRAGAALLQEALKFASALIAVCGVTALLIQGLLGLAALALSIDVFHVAIIRTLTICLISLVLAFAGSRWGRLELTRIAYGALAFVAAKILLEDLRHGRMEFIAGSIFLFAVTLMAVPRMARIKGRSHSVSKTTVPNKV